jgi:Rab GDP dissociation inhibitor
MDEVYDCVVLGTGLKECIISGVLSVEGKKVLHMDRNNYYGAESASLNLNQFYEKFHPGVTPPANLGASRDYNVDLVPKFLMASGLMVKFLLKTGVTRYLEFQSVQNSYVYKDKKIYKVPTTPMEIMASSLMGMFEKRRCAEFQNFVQSYKQEDPKTHSGFDLTKHTMNELYKKFGLDENTQSFIGHAVALYTTDDYQNRPASETIEKILLYKDSLLQYGGNSPYIYPRYGLGELPQAFARLAAIYGGTYMLDKPIDEIVYGPDGKVTGVKSQGEVARCKFVVGDPSYFPDKVKKVGKVVRLICILNHPIPNTNNENSLQIILPQRELKRKFDIYVMCISAEFFVVPKGKYMAIVSTNAETNNPEAELKPALDLLGPIEQKFLSICDLYEPLADGKNDQVFISTSYDGVSHFETTSEDVLSIYKRITGKDMDLTPMKQPEDQQ